MAAATLSCACTLCPLKRTACTFRPTPSQGVVAVRVGGVRIRCAAGGGVDRAQLRLGFSTSGVASGVLEQLSADLEEQLGLGDEGAASSSSSGIDPRERMRRERISHSNKGKVPWNKGKRHSPETIAKIKERTKLAMLNPEVRDKLRQCGKNQSKETKAKIRSKMVGFWESKRAMKQAQEVCERSWKDVVAEAARVGGVGDEEFEWNSYKIMKEQCRLGDIAAARQKKQAMKASRKVERAKKKPISDAHRKAISDAIRAKWADPAYQAKVAAGVAKIDLERRRKRADDKRDRVLVSPKRKRAVPKATTTEADAEEIQDEKRKPAQVDEDFIAEVLAEEVTLQTRSERSTAARIKGPRKVTLVSLEDHYLPAKDVNETAAEEKSAGEEEGAVFGGRVPSEETDVKPPSARPEGVQLCSKLTSQSYKDPLVLEKVQRIQQLRKGRLEVELKRKEAADRARMLIANAERAASALEQAGSTDAATTAKLIETRKLLAEATRAMQAAEMKQGASSSGRPRNLDTRENEKPLSLSTNSDFHSRIWTSGDNLADCPHPIPIRIGSMRSNEHQLHLGIDGNVRSRSSSWASSRSEDQAQSSRTRKSHDESLKSEGSFNSVAGPSKMNGKVWRDIDEDERT